MDIPYALVFFTSKGIDLIGLYHNLAACMREAKRWAGGGWDLEVCYSLDALQLLNGTL